MKKSIIFIVLAMLCVYFSADAQSESRSIPKIEPLLIGDRVPDIEFKNVLNYKDPGFRLSDFKGKAIIIDFWATYCGACLHYMPHIMALQKMFSGKLQVLTYNDAPLDTKEKIEVFLEKRKGTKDEFTAPVIYQDIANQGYFPRRKIPHYVWIGLDGRIKAITLPESVTEENVRMLISGAKLHLPVKED
jgi:thiol-disulfide isomerase/thioredoxin